MIEKLKLILRGHRLSSPWVACVCSCHAGLDPASSPSLGRVAHPAASGSADGWLYPNITLSIYVLSSILGAEQASIAEEEFS